MNFVLKQYEFTYVRQEDGVVDRLMIMSVDAREALQSFFDGDPHAMKHFAAMIFKGDVQTAEIQSPKDRHGLRIVK